MACGRFLLAPEGRAKGLIKITQQKLDKLSALAHGKINLDYI